MKEKESTNILKIIALIVLVAGFAWFIGRISWVIQLFVVSLLIVYVLFPIAEYLKKRFKFRHFYAVTVTFLFFLLLIFILVSLIVPVVQKETQGILSDFPFYLKLLQGYIEDLSTILETFDFSVDFADIFPDLSASFQSVLEETASFSVSLISVILDLFFILFLVFYLLYDFQDVREAVIKLVPQRYERNARDIMRIIDLNFGGFIRGNILRCAIVGLLTGLILFAFGMPYSLLLGILAGVLNIILYIGPYIAAVPAVILGFSPDTPSVIVVIAIYLFVQAIDGVILSPLLLGRSVRLKPVTVIASLLIGQQLAGILGMIISTPLAGIIKSLMGYAREERMKRGNT